MPYQFIGWNSTEISKHCFSVIDQPQVSEKISTIFTLASWNKLFSPVFLLTTTTLNILQGHLTLKRELKQTFQKMAKEQ